MFMIISPKGEARRAARPTVVALTAFHLLEARHAAATHTARREPVALDDRGVGPAFCVDQADETTVHGTASDFDDSHGVTASQVLAGLEVGVLARGDLGRGH